VLTIVFERIRAKNEIAE